MKRKQLLIGLLGAAIFSTALAGCGDEKKENEDGVKEFTAFFAVPRFGESMLTMKSRLKLQRLQGQNVRKPG